MSRPSSRARPAAAILRPSCQENFYLGVWKNDGSAIAAFGDQAGDTDRHIDAGRPKVPAHLGEGTDLRSQSAICSSPISRVTSSLRGGPGLFRCHAHAPMSAHRNPNNGVFILHVHTSPMRDIGQPSVERTGRNPAPAQPGAPNRDLTRTFLMLPVHQW